MARGDIQGILFDKDGTLFDFEASWAGVVRAIVCALTPDTGRRAALAQAVGFDAATGRFQAGAAAVAGSVAEVAALWAGLLPGRAPAEIEALANRIAEDAVAGGQLVPAVADLAGFLGGLVAEGYVLGVATHDSEAAARAHLQAFGALQTMSFIAGYDSGFGLKPGPGMLLGFAETVALSPGQVVMVGDSVHDLGVAPAAGAAMGIGVLTGPARHADLAPHADHVIASIADLPALLRAAEKV